MAWSEKDLNTEWITPVRVPGGANITLDAVSKAIAENANANGIPVAFNKSQVKVGTVFNRALEDVLAMYNPQQPDYLHFIVRVQHMGNYAFIHVYNMGGSKSFGIMNASQEDGIFGGIAKARKFFGGVSSKVQQEEQYYAILKDCIEDIFQ